MSSSHLSPDFLKRLELFSLHSRKAFLGQRQGAHISPRKGHGIEFSDYRQYELGDSPRHIDWGLYARTDRLYVKRFQEEEDLTALIMLDSSASMFVDEGDEKWKKATDLALSIAYVGLMNNDTVTFSLLGVTELPKYSSGSAFPDIVRQLNIVRKESARTFEADMILRAVSRVRFPGIAVLITDCLMERAVLFRALNILRARNLSISLVCVLGSNDIAPLADNDQGICVDSESSEEIPIVWDSDTAKNYSRALRNHLDEIGHFCRSSGMRFIEWPPKIPLSDIVFSELTRVGVLR